MKREHVLTYLRVAGYHDDRAAFTRLYVENRIGYKAAQDAYRAGRAARDAGVRCDCHDCKHAPSGQKG